MGAPDNNESLRTFLERARIQELRVLLFNKELYRDDQEERRTAALKAVQHNGRIDHDEVFANLFKIRAEAEYNIKIEEEKKNSYNDQELFKELYDFGFRILVDKHECRRCNKVFYVNRFHSKKEYCSSDCATGVYVERRRAKILASRPKNYNVKRCLFCKKKFNAKRKDTKFCCLSCRVKSFQHAH